MARINDLVDSVIGLLASALKHTERGALPAGKVRDVVLADSDFSKVIQTGGGKYALPLIGVGYAGSIGSAIDTGGDIHEGENKIGVLIAVQNRAGVDDALAELYDLVDSTIDAVMAQPAIKRTRAGVAILDDEDAEQIIGSSFEFVGDSPLALPSAAEAKGVLAWSVGFKCLGHYQAPQPADTYFEEIEGDYDIRPGEDPETPDDDLAPFAIAEDEWDED